MASANSNTTAGGDSNVEIAVMGATGSGKTTLINLASNSNLRVGVGLQPCTSTVDVSQPFDIDGQRVTLIDTPGFDDTNKSDADILKMIIKFLADGYESGKKLAGVIYIHRISDFRMGGTAMRNFRLFRQLCGQDALKNVVIVTNMWSVGTMDKNLTNEKELQDNFFKEVLDQGAQMRRHDNTFGSAHEIIAGIVKNQPVPMRAQEEVVDEGKSFGETSAGRELDKELEALLQKHKEEMDGLRQEMQEAIRSRDEQTRRELEPELRKLREDIARAETDRQKLASDYAEGTQRMETQMQEQREEVRQDAERRTAEYNNQMQILRDRLDQADANKRDDLLFEIRHLRQQFEERQGLFSKVGTFVDNLFRW